MQPFSSTTKAYLAGFLDGDGSIYVRLKPNPTYKYGFQVAPYVVFFQSQKSKKLFVQLCSRVGSGYIRERGDGVVEYIIGRTDAIREFLEAIRPYVVLKKQQTELMLEILEFRKRVANKKDFRKLMKMIDQFRNLNYSKKRLRRTLTP
ncbi:MAG: LAGLIDADG family homing endonuclease [Minisyncoccia bacterium]